MTFVLIMQVREMGIIILGVVASNFVETIYNFFAYYNINDCISSPEDGLIAEIAAE